MMSNSDLLAYSANVHRGIAAAFVGDGLGAYAYSAIQAPHTLTYPFRLDKPTIANVSKALRLNRAIEAMTNVSPVRITTEQGLVMVEVPSPVPAVIEGRTLQGEGLAVPVGMSSKGQIVGVDFEQDSHLLIVGATNKGKTVASRNIVYQLIRQHTPDQAQFIVSAFKRKNWKSFSPFAHIITDKAETLDMLHQVHDLMQWRGGNEVETPRLFVVLDDSLDLFAYEGVNEIASKLLPNSRGVGINFILISQRKSGMDRKVTGNCTAQLLFNVADVQDSAIVGGRGDLGAETLGRYPGDCLLIANEGVTRVASALVTDGDVEALAASKPWRVEAILEGVSKSLPNGENGFLCGSGSDTYSNRFTGRNRFQNRFQQYDLPDSGSDPEAEAEATGSDYGSDFGSDAEAVEIAEMLASGASNKQIAMAVYGVSGGRRYSEVVRQIEIVRAVKSL